MKTELTWVERQIIHYALKKCITEIMASTVDNERKEWIAANPDWVTTQYRNVEFIRELDGKIWVCDPEDRELSHLEPRKQT
jgi:hypothetical protein